MSAIARLRGWLDGRQDYQEGLQLVEELSTNQVLLGLLRRGPGPFTTRKLCEEVSRLLKELPAAVVEHQVRAAPTAAVVATTKPPEVVALEAERLLTFKQAAQLHGQLRRIPTKEERFEAAKQIKALWRRNAEIWDALQYYAEHGQLPALAPEHPAVEAGDLVAMTKRRNTLRTYISSQRGTPEKRQAWAAELADLNRRLGEEGE